MVLVFGTRQTLRMFVGSSDLLGTREARQPVFDGKFELLEPYNLKRVEPAERAQLLKPRIKPLVTREQSEELVGHRQILLNQNTTFDRMCRAGTRVLGGETYPDPSIGNIRCGPTSRSALLNLSKCAAPEGPGPARAFWRIRARRSSPLTLPANSILI